MEDNSFDCELLEIKGRSVIISFENKKQVVSLFFRLLFKMMKRSSPFNLFIKMNGRRLKA